MAKRHGLPYSGLPDMAKRSGHPIRVTHPVLGCLSRYWATANVAITIHYVKQKLVEISLFQFLA